MAKTKAANEIDPGVLDELLKGVKDDGDLHGVLRQLSKQLIERKMGAEIPRDRQSSFEPQLVKKHQRRLAGHDSRCRSTPVV